MNNQLTEIWNDKELQLKQQSIRTTLINHSFVVNIPPYHLSAVLDYEHEEPKDFMNYNRMIRLMVDDPQKALKQLSSSDGMVTDIVDQMGIFDYDGDGDDEILLRQCLLYNPTYSDLASVHLLFEIKDNQMVIKKAFSAIKNTIQAQLLDQLMVEGNMGPPFNETLSYWIETGFVKKEDVNQAAAKILSSKK